MKNGDSINLNRNGDSMQNSYDKWLDSLTEADKQEMEEESRREALEHLEGLFKGIGRKLPLA